MQTCVLTNNTDFILKVWKGINSVLQFLILDRKYSFLTIDPIKLNSNVFEKLHCFWNDINIHYTHTSPGTTLSAAPITITEVLVRSTNVKRIFGVTRVIVNQPNLNYGEWNSNLYNCCREQLNQRTLLQVNLVSAAQLPA